MVTHSRILAWRIPWMEEPGRLQSMGSQRVGHDWGTSLYSLHTLSLEKEMTTHSSILFFFFPFTFISWRLITLQYCSGFCHTLTISAMDLHVFPIPVPPPNSSILAWRVPWTGAWLAGVHGVTESWTWLKWPSTHTHICIYICNV